MKFFYFNIFSKLVLEFIYPVIFFNISFSLLITVSWFPWICSVVLFLINFFSYILSSPISILSFVTMKDFIALESLLNTTVIISLKFLWLLFSLLFSEYSKTEACVCVHVQANKKVMVQFQLVWYFYVSYLLVIKLLFCSSVLIIYGLSNHPFWGIHWGFPAGCLWSNIEWVFHRPLKRKRIYWSVKSLILLVKYSL